MSENQYYMFFFLSIFFFSFLSLFLYFFFIFETGTHHPFLCLLNRNWVTTEHHHTTHTTHTLNKGREKLGGSQSPSSRNNRSLSLTPHSLTYVFTQHSQCVWWSRIAHSMKTTDRASCPPAVGHPHPPPPSQKLSIFFLYFFFFPSSTVTKKKNNNMSNDDTYGWVELKWYNLLVVSYNENHPCLRTIMFFVTKKKENNMSKDDTYGWVELNWYELILWTDTIL